MRAPFFLFALVAALALACFVSPFASEKPDGLDRFAHDHAMEAAPVWKRAPMEDYGVHFISKAGVSTGLAGGIGTLLVFAFLTLGGRALAFSRKQRATPEAGCKP